MNRSSGGSDYGSHPTNPWIFQLKLGLYAGVIWGLARLALYYLQFTRVIPGLMAEPFFRHSFLLTMQGHVTGLACFILFSVLAAYLYLLVLGFAGGPMPGILYGLLWWAVIFSVIGPLLGATKPVTLLGWNSLLTELCIFILWGVFIGYTTAFEFHDEASREPAA
ncbi:YqhR family membrane protein [Paenibacillus beijingensis]|nr:YqhR family membrane protein [Paenibacillus beijingensis]